MRSPVDALVTEKSLSFVSVSRGASVLDLVVDGVIESNLPLKNVCAKVAPELSDEIDKICHLLDISKRRFLEAAFIEAVQKAKAIMKEEGVFQSLDGHFDDPTKEDYDASRSLDSNE